jgi:hypothetical protein
VGDDPEKSYESILAVAKGKTGLVILIAMIPPGAGTRQGVKA